MFQAVSPKNEAKFSTWLVSEETAAVNISEHQVGPSNYYMFLFFLRNPFLPTDFLGFQDRMAPQECREFLAPQGPKDNKVKMELRGSLVSRDRSDRDAPGMIGLKGDKYNVGCSRGRCFWNSLRWQFTLSVQLIKPINPVIPLTDVVP